MDLLRTIVWFVYFFGYMVVHLGDLKKAEQQLAAGDMAAVDAATEKHVTHWCRTLLKMAGVKVTVTGQENIPQGRPSVFVSNHRSYYDIPLMLTCLDRPHGILAKQEVEKIPLVRRWMRLLGCVYVQRDDVRASLKALNDGADQVKNGRSFVVFPEGTRNKGEEGSLLEFKAGAFRIATKGKAPVVPVVIRNSRDIMENNHMLMHPSQVSVTILPPVETDGLDKEGQKKLPAIVQEMIQEELNREQA